MAVLALLGFNTMLDALNMGASNTYMHRNNFLKHAINRFILSTVFIYLFLVNEFASSTITAIVGLSALFLMVITEFKFVKRSNKLTRLIALTKTLFTKYMLLGLFPLVILSVLVFYTNFIVYLSVLGGIILIGISVYILVYNNLIYKLVRLVSYDRIFDNQLYEEEPSLKDDLFIAQSEKLNLPMNALFMGLFKMKRIILTPKIVAYLNAKEVKAIIYHELGHYHHKHLRKRLGIIFLIVLAYISIGLMFFTLPIVNFLGLPYTLFNVIVLIGISVYVLESIIETFMIRLMHKQEFEADLYVKDHFDAQALINALRKIKTIESEVIYHPLYQRLKVSHPSMKNRIKQLKG